MRTRLLLVDDHILFREGLSRLLASESDFQVVGHCGTSSDALQILQKSSVDVLLLDFDIGKDHGAQMISAARTAGYTGKILMVTAGMNAKQSSVALKLGASGIFLKHNSPG
jgi:two-component system, NarL family, nitrate/nitrite response regulator NarL